MKKLLFASLVLIGGLGVCSTAPAAITGSKHDFSQAGAFLEGGQICLPCHAPHNNLNATGEVLWNHLDTTANFILYDSPTMDAIAGQPREVSKFCLSCHDGVTAIDAYAAHAGTETIGVAYPGTTADLGTDLSDDHPISIVYDETDTGLNVKSALPPTIPLFGAGSDQVECASCHDVHNKLGLAKLVNVTMEGSALCLECHNK